MGYDKKRSVREESISLLMLEQLERRRPQAVTSGDDYASGLLTGVIAGSEYVKSAEWEDEDRALAAMKVRRYFMQHPCTRLKAGDPPCEHPHHYRDVAQARWVLEILGISGDTALIPLADAVKELWHHRND